MPSARCRLSYVAATRLFGQADARADILCSWTHGRPHVVSQAECPPCLPIPAAQAVCSPSSFTGASSRAHVFLLPACTLRTQTYTSKLVTSPFLALEQILGPLDHDDQCGKQKLAYKLEQVITLMSLDS